VSNERKFTTYLDVWYRHRRTEWSAVLSSDLRWFKH